MTSTNDKSIPLPVFDGKEKNYPIWKVKMTGFLRAKGILIAITQKDKLAASEAIAVSGDEEKKVRTANELAMAYLLRRSAESYENTEAQ